MKKQTDFYVYKGLQHIDEKSKKEWENFVEQWCIHNGTAGLYEMTSIIEKLSNRESFCNIYSYCKTLKLDNGLLNVLLSFTKYFNLRAEKFILYWNMKNNEYNQYDIEMDDQLRELSIRNLSIDTAYSLNHGVSFDDILSIFEAIPRRDYNMLEEIVNKTSSFTKRGKEFKDYFYANNNIFIDKQPDSVKIKK